MLRRWKPSRSRRLPPVKCTLCWAALIWYTFAEQLTPALQFSSTFNQFFFIPTSTIFNSVRVGCFILGIVIVLCNGQTCYIACGGQFISNGFVIFWMSANLTRNSKKWRPKFFLAAISKTLPLSFIRFALPYAFISNGTATCQSVVTSVAKQVLLYEMWHCKSVHTFDAGALIVIVALAINFISWF